MTQTNKLDRIISLAKESLVLLIKENAKAEAFNDVLEGIDRTSVHAERISARFHRADAKADRYKDTYDTYVKCLSILTDEEINNVCMRLEKSVNIFEIFTQSYNTHEEYARSYIAQSCKEGSDGGMRSVYTRTIGITNMVTREHVGFLD